MMGLFEHWPYTNFHDLNLDWIIKKIKNVETAEANTAASAEAAAESAAASQHSAEASQHSAEASQHSAEESAAEVSSIAGKAAQIDLNTARIDNILVQGTPTEGNAELIDIRVGANGTTYATAGDAVRALDTYLQDTDNIISKGYNRIFFSDIVGSYPTTDGIVDYPNWHRSDMIPVNPGEDLYVINTNSTRDNVWYRADESVISSFTIPVGNPAVIRAPRDARYMIVSNNAGNIIKTIYRKSAGTLSLKTNIVMGLAANAMNILDDANNAELNKLYCFQLSSIDQRPANVPSYIPQTFYLITLEYVYGTISMSTVNKQIIFARDLHAVCYRENNAGTWSAWTLADGSTIRVGASQPFTTLKEACTEAYKAQNVKIIVHPGTYDMSQEFSSEIAAATGEAGNIIGKGMHLFFMDGSKVIAEFNSGDYSEAQWSWLYDNFSPFYAGDGDYIIEGLDISASNCRYCVHDEKSGSGNGKHNYINCRMVYKNEHTPVKYMQCIGGGLGRNMTINIEGGSYKSITTYPFPGLSIDDSQIPISYHNGNNPQADSSINIKNVYLEDRGYMRFGYYGTSPTVSRIMISGSSMFKHAWLKPENSTAEVVNFEIIEYCNEIRE